MLWFGRRLFRRRPAHCLELSECIRIRLGCPPVFITIDTLLIAGPTEDREDGDHAEREKKTDMSRSMLLHERKLSVFLRIRASLFRTSISARTGAFDSAFLFEPDIRNFLRQTHALATSRPDRHRSDGPAVRQLHRQARRLASRIATAVPVKKVGVGSRLWRRFR
jgi:hypothetical protein